MRYIFHRTLLGLSSVIKKEYRIYYIYLATLYTGECRVIGVIGVISRVNYIYLIKLYCGEFRVMRGVNTFISEYFTHLLMGHIYIYIYIYIYRIIKAVIYIAIRSIIYIYIYIRTSNTLGIPPTTNSFKNNSGATRIYKSNPPKALLRDLKG